MWAIVQLNRMPLVCDIKDDHDFKEMEEIKGKIKLYLSFISTKMREKIELHFLTRFREKSVLNWSMINMPRYRIRERKE